MTDARIRILPPLLLAVAGLAVAGCASQPVATESPLPTEQVVNVPAEAAFPAEAEDGRDARPRNSRRSAPEVEPLAPAVAYGDVIVRIRSKLSLPQVSHPRVDREIEWLQRNPDYLARVFGRAQRYLHHIANEVEYRGLPGDLALLPVVESAFNPFAYSRAHASGLWQFIAPTGERYGLRRNYWQDKRRDVLESTRGALEYLTDTQRTLRRRLVPGDRGLQLRPGQRPARDQPQQGARPADRFLLALAACRDAGLRAEAGRAREDGQRAGPLRLLPAADPGCAVLPRRADRRPGGPAPDGGTRGRRSRGTARAEPVLEPLDDGPGRPAPRAGPGGRRGQFHGQARGARSPTPARSWPSTRWRRANRSLRSPAATRCRNPSSTA